MALGWKTVSIDWANDVVQAVLEKLMYMATPRDFLNKYGNLGCLRLEKSVYGSTYTPLLWWLISTCAMKQLSLKQSLFDQCLFYRDGLLIVLHVDDAGVASPAQDGINTANLGFNLTLKESSSPILGSRLMSSRMWPFICLKKGLIEKVISSAGMKDCNPNWTPTTQAGLGSDPNGEPYDSVEWNYASIVGMILYLSNITRPGITFAVSQVARFRSKPKKSHACCSNQYSIPSTKIRQRYHCCSC